MLIWLAHECPDIWSNIILSVWEKVFLDETDMWIFGLGEGDCPSSVGGPHPISWRPGSTKRANTLTIKIDLFLPDFLSWNISLFLPETLALPESEICWLFDWNYIINWLFWVSTIFILSLSPWIYLLIICLSIYVFICLCIDIHVFILISMYLTMYAGM